MRYGTLPLLLLALASLNACENTELDAPRSERCPAALGSESGADLVLNAGGPCAASLKLTLRVATGEPTAPTWTPADASGLEVEGAWTLDGDAAVRTVRLRNAAATDVTVVGLEWSSGADGLGMPADRLLNNGYQSWSYSGFRPIPATVTEALGTAEPGGDDESTTDDRHGVAWWWTAVSDGRGRGLVAGADTAKVFKSFIAVDGAEQKRVRIVFGMNGDSLRLTPGAAIDLDGLYLRFGNLEAGLRAYAAHVAARNGAAPGAPLGGWGSWNVYYDKPTAELLRQDMAWAKKHLAPAGLTDFLLDDGYEPFWGEWFAKPEFGAALDDLNAEQTKYGLTPAVWLAPFYVDTKSALVTDHPDWFVRNEDGSLRTYDNISAIHAVLDVTNPGAVAHVRQSLANYRAWGYKTIKIDFLFGGAVPGVRQRHLTSMQSYAAWMKVVREAAGDMHVIGCGAPLLPSVGWVDSMRTGPDIAFSVFPDPRYAFIQMQARNTATRWFTDAWWAIDPDVILLRGRRITDLEAWMAVVSGALTGGNYLLGDGRQSSALRQAMALDPEILALRDGVAAVPVDLDTGVDERMVATPIADLEGKSHVPHLWKKRDADGRTWLAAFAWNDMRYAAEVNFPPGAVEIVPPAAAGETAALRGVAPGARRIAVEPHGVRLFRW